jgi:hypothetical protein
MKTLRLTLRVKALDAYLYSGYLLVVLKDGTFRAVHLEELHSILVKRHPEHSGIFRTAFLRNDWLTNPQADALLSSANQSKAFRRDWERAASLDIDIEDLPWSVVCEIPDVHLQDFRLYWMRAYLATRSGTYEALMQYDAKAMQPKVQAPFQRVIDAKTLYLTARAGEVVMSAGSDGLFHGVIMDPSQPILFQNHCSIASSIRTGWSGFDVINYETQSTFTYLRNEVETVKSRRHHFSPDDESSEKKTISSFASEQISMEQFLYRLDLSTENVRLSFNNLERCFFILNDNKCVAAYVDRSGNSPHLKRRLQTIATIRGVRSLKDLGRPYSAIGSELGTVIEFFDRVVLVHGGRAQLLESLPAISVRTFPTSRRFRRIVLITQEDSVVIHSVPPTRSPQYLPKTLSDVDGGGGHLRHA